MPNVQYFINNQYLGEPRNWQDLEITVNWETQSNSGTVNVSELAFVGKPKEYINNHIREGLNGGVGIFEGIPLDIVVKDDLNNEYAFNGYMDLTEGLKQIGNEETIVNVKKIKGDDWIADVADGFSFAYLYDQNVIRDNDFVKIPYVINFIPDGLHLTMVSLSIYMLTKEMVENIDKTQELVRKIINASTPGVVVTTSGVGSSWDIGDYIENGLYVVARIVYQIAMTVAMIKLAEELFAQFIQKKRFYNGMTFKRMFEKACEYKNLTFASPIEELNWVYMPPKSGKGDGRDKGFPTNTESIYTFGGLLRVAKEMFNADYMIIDNVFYFYRRDGYNVQSGFQTPNLFIDQERLLDTVEFNTDEMISNYNIHWSYDIQDQNTIEDNAGYTMQAITTPYVSVNPDLVNIKNLAEISLPFSLGKEKRSLNTLEQTLKIFGRLIDNITGIFGGGTNFASKVESRIGALLLSSHQTTIGKVIKMNGGSLANNQRQELSAMVLWDKFHFINSMAEINGKHNQYYVYREYTVPMTLRQFLGITSSFRATDQDGNEIEILIAKYSPMAGKAVIDFRQNKKYTNNLKVKIIE